MGETIRRKLSERRTGKTDWKAVEAQTDDDIAAAVAADPDAAPIMGDDFFAGAAIKERGDEKCD